MRNLVLTACARSLGVRTPSVTLRCRAANNMGTHRYLKWTPKFGQVAKLRIASEIERNDEESNHDEEKKSS